MLGTATGYKLTDRQIIKEDPMHEKECNNGKKDVGEGTKARSNERKRCIKQNKGLPIGTETLTRS